MLLALKLANNNILGGWILWKRYRSLLFKQQGLRALRFKLLTGTVISSVISI